MKSPFKFLDAFTLKDRAAFIGRDKEIETLYEMLFKSPLVMVFGFSGTGKTSLIQCGLASKFDGPDWFPFYIRRESNINQSLNNALDYYLQDEELLFSLTKKVNLLYSDYLSPIYLIFDQFEELFISGTKEEQNTFVKGIKELVEAKIACKIILVIREEFLGSLYKFEQFLPGINDFRMRVETMSKVKIKKVISNSFNNFNISFDAEPEVLINKMIKNISGEESVIRLPYLQVYLDLLYRKEYQRVFGNKQLLEGHLPKFAFTEKGIEELGEIKDVLEQFIQEQESQLQDELSFKFRPIEENLVHTLLDKFVTEEGTKDSIHYKREDTLILPEKRFIEKLPSTIPINIISCALSNLQERRILRLSDHTIELAHDSLAQVIDQNRTALQRDINKARIRIKNSFKEYKDKKEVFLTGIQIKAFRELIPYMGLSEEIKEYIEKSKDNVIKLNKAKAARKYQPWIISLLAFAIAASAAAFWGLNQATKAKNQAINAKNKEEQARMELAIEKTKSHLSLIQPLKWQGKYEMARKSLDHAENEIIKSNLCELFQDSLQQFQYLRQNINSTEYLEEKARILLDTDDWTDTLKLKVLDIYNKILEKDPRDEFIKLKKALLVELIYQSANNWYDRAQIYVEYGEKEELRAARTSLNFAMMLDPGNKKMITYLRAMIANKQ